eukprot:TRINITY_DN14991_c0_g1_i1.p1 TRINITY_DN14991_c0_g1~~TRINITY_DN14991_c0_g1_i1.p1  ORF type:complete len:336 (+),score=109.31 TRINITY_DN14991_c0_g1_i1:41-1048(+)
MKLLAICLILCLAVLSANCFKVPVEIDDDSIIAQVLIGAGKHQKIPLRFDADQDVTWVGTVNCKQCVAEKPSVPFFNTTSSATYKSTGKTDEFNCDPGSMDGFVSTDNFAFGPGAAVKSLDFVAMDHDNSCKDFNELPGNFAGRLSVSPKSDTHKNIFYELVDQKVISKPTMQLRKKTTSSGELIFGEETSTVSFTEKVINPQAWMIQGKSVSFGGNTIDTDFLGFSFGNYAFVGPEESINLFYKTIGATDMPQVTGVKVVDCGRVGSLPPVTFNTHSGATITIKDTEYIKNYAGNCLVLAYGFSEPTKYWAVGNPATVDNSIVMNIKDMTIGFQ